MSSADGGATWIKPVDLSDGPGQGYNQSVPGPSPDGRIDAAWFDFRHDPLFVAKGTVKQRSSDIYGTSSSDDGQTWTKNHRVCSYARSPVVP